MQFHWINATDNDLCGEHSDINEMIRCDISFVSTFVIPAILILVTYIYGIYLFWERNEHLENLAGQVWKTRIYEVTVYILYALYRCS